MAKLTKKQFSIIESMQTLNNLCDLTMDDNGNVFREVFDRDMPDFLSCVGLNGVTTSSTSKKYIYNNKSILKNARSMFNDCWIAFSDIPEKLQKTVNIDWDKIESLLWKE